MIPIVIPPIFELICEHERQKVIFHGSIYPIVFVFHFPNILFPGCLSYHISTYISTWQL